MVSRVIELWCSNSRLHRFDLCLVKFLVFFRVEFQIDSDWLKLSRGLRSIKHHDIFVLTYKSLQFAFAPPVLKCPLLRCLGQFPLVAPYRDHLQDHPPGRALLVLQTDIRNAMETVRQGIEAGLEAVAHHHSRAQKYFFM